MSESVDTKDISVGLEEIIRGLENPPNYLTRRGIRSLATRGPLSKGAIGAPDVTTPPIRKSY